MNPSMDTFIALMKIAGFTAYMIYLARKYRPMPPEIPYCPKCDNIRWYGNFYVNNCKGHE